MRALTSGAGLPARASQPDQSRKTSRGTIVLLLLLCAGCRGSIVKQALESGGQGVASWYGDLFQGRLTANGEKFDMNQNTAAHRTLPFGTRLRVHDLRADRTTEVRINDRGPYVKDRIIDLSRKAGADLDLMTRGTTTVELLILERPRTRGPELYAVQVGMLPDRDSAERLRQEMAARYGAARVLPRDGEPVLYRVLVGSEETEAAAEALKLKMQRSDDLFVVMLDEQ